jgi:hypothetical protein
MRFGNFGDAASRLDAVAFGIGLGAQLGDDDSIHQDLSAANQVFRMAPRRNSGTGDYFLQAFKHGFI